MKMFSHQIYYPHGNWQSTAIPYTILPPPFNAALPPLFKTTRIPQVPYDATDVPAQWLILKILKITQIKRLLRALNEDHLHG